MKGFAVHACYAGIVILGFVAAFSTSVSAQYLRGYEFYGIEYKAEIVPTPRNENDFEASYKQQKQRFQRLQSELSEQYLKLDADLQHEKSLCMNKTNPFVRVRCISAADLKIKDNSNAFVESLRKMAAVRDEKIAQLFAVRKQFTLDQHQARKNLSGSGRIEERQP